MKVTSTESGGYPTELAPAGESRPRGCNRASKFQFRISTILLAMLGSALVLSIVTQVDLESWFANAPRRSYHEPSGAWRWLGHPLVTIGLIELIAGMAVVEVLARNIPRAIKPRPASQLSPRRWYLVASSSESGKCEHLPARS